MGCHTSKSLQSCPIPKNVFTCGAGGGFGCIMPLDDTNKHTLRSIISKGTTIKLYFTNGTSDDMNKITENSAIKFRDLLAPPNKELAYKLYTTNLGATSTAFIDELRGTRLVHGVINKKENEEFRVNTTLSTIPYGLKGICAIEISESSKPDFVYNIRSKDEKGEFNVTKLKVVRLFVQEMCKGHDLVNALNAGEKVKFQIFKPVVELLKKMHEANIYHRDIKLENILICGGAVCKLIDFGFTTIYDSKVTLHCQGSPGFSHPNYLKFACNTLSFPYDTMPSDVRQRYKAVFEEEHEKAKKSPNGFTKEVEQDLWATFERRVVALEFAKQLDDVNITRKRTNREMFNYILKENDNFAMSQVFFIITRFLMTQHRKATAAQQNAETSEKKLTASFDIAYFDREIMNFLHAYDSISIPVKYP